MYCDVIKLLPRHRALAYAAAIKRRKELWLPRGGFYTLGATTYLDEPDMYPALSEYTNVVVSHLWGNLQYEVMDAIPKHFAPKRAYRKKGTTIMGAHMFTPETNGHTGNPHIDEPYKRINWGDRKSVV